MKTVTPSALVFARRDILHGMLAAGAIGFFINILHLALPLYNSQVLDRVISSGSFETLAALTMIVAIVLLFQGTLDFLRSKLFAILAARVAERLGRPVFEASVETTLRHGAAPAANAVRDLSELRNFVAGGALALPMDLVFAPVFLTVLFVLHPYYGLVGLVGALLLTAAALATEFLVRRPAKKSTLVAGEVQVETATAIRSAEVIAAMGMIGAVGQRWRLMHSRSLDSFTDGRAVAKALSSLARTLRIAIQIAIICTGTSLVVMQEASVGTIIAATVIMSRLLLPFEMMIDGWRQWVDALTAVERIGDILTLGAAARSSVPIAIESGDLVVDRVSFVPQGQNVPTLRNVSFRVAPGELLGIIGPSGAGKSTLARLVVGLWDTTAGGIFLDGQQTYLWERSSFGAGVGYLPQQPSLLEGTIAENIARFQAGRMEEVVAAARIARVHEMIGRLPNGYATRISEGGSLLSGGQRQRIALARAIFGNPKLLVLDEPNSSLDAEGEAALVEVIEQARGMGAAVVVVAQRMSILARANLLLHLKDGVVANFGDRAEVLAALAPQRQIRQTPSQSPNSMTALG